MNDCPVKSTKDLMNRLNVAQYPGRWDGLFEIAEKKFNQLGGVFPSQDALSELQRKYGLFQKVFDVIQDATKRLEKNPVLTFYTILLNLAMEDRPVFKTELSEWEIPLAPLGADSIPYDFVLLFALLPTVEHTDRILRERGVPEDIIRSTLTAYEECTILFHRWVGRYGLNKRYFRWLQLYVDVMLLRIGRLNFEMRARFRGPVYVFENSDGDYCMFMTDVRLHREGVVLGIPGYIDEEGAYDADFIETDSYYEGHMVGQKGIAQRERTRLAKSEWRIVLTPEDPVLSIHIPGGEKLLAEQCEEAYQRAKIVFPECFPEFKYKAFVCFSWLMDPQLSDMLPEGSNIVAFQNKFMRFPTYSSGMGVMDFVYYKRYDHYEEMPERTSLERRIKQHYLNNKYIYEPGGVFFN